MVAAPSAGFDRAAVLPLFRRIYGNGITLTNLNMEQMPSPANRTYRAPRDEFSRRVVKHFVWSRSYRDFLMEHDVDPANVFVTGRPGTQLLREKAAHGKDRTRAQLAARFGPQELVGSIPARIHISKALSAHDWLVAADA